MKVLDFGLAKATEPAASSSPALAMSPTITSPARAMTQAGMILGTAAYMSPEQARGKSVDKRSDIWAFGLVLYEMLTGRAAFAGDTITDVLAAIVTREPDWTRCPQPRRHRSDGCSHAVSRRTRSAGCATSVRRGWRSKRRPRAVPGNAVPCRRLLSRLDPACRAPLDHASRRSSGHWRESRWGRSPSAPWWLPGSGHARARPRRARCACRSSTPTARSRRARDFAGRPARGVPSATRRRHAAALDARTGQRQIAVSARHRGCLLAVLVAGLARPGVLHWRVLEAGTGGGRPGSDRRRQRRHLWRWRRRVGDRRDDRVQWAKRAVPRAGRRRRRGSSDEGCRARIGRTSGRASCRTAAGSCSPRSCGPVPRKPANKASTSGRWTARRSQRLLPDLSSAVYAPPGYLVFVREGTLTAAPFDLAAGRVTGPPVAIGGAVATEAPVLLRGHFCVGRRDAGGATATGGRADQRRHERVQCGTASGRSQRHGQPRRHRAALLVPSWRSTRWTAASSPRRSSTHAPARRTCD